MQFLRFIGHLINAVRPFRLSTLLVISTVSLCIGLTGCGTTQSRVATEQLLMSDAVDEAVARIDFRTLSGEKVYFDTQYVKAIKGFGFVNADYIVSSLRQQMIAADCRLQEDREDADFIVEARVGTLGTNSHEVVYGAPANHSLSTAASFVPNVPALPAIPEISVGRKDAQMGAAKLAVFAYERESKRPVWQSGVAQAKSDAHDLWVFGAGPFQRGSIYNGTQFAGTKLRVPKLNDEPISVENPPIALQQQFHFPRPVNAWPQNAVQPAGFPGSAPPYQFGPQNLNGMAPPGASVPAETPQEEQREE